MAPPNASRSTLSSVVPEDLVSPIFAFRVALDLSGQKMYWTAPTQERISRSNLDGQQVEEDLARFFSFPTGVALDVTNGKMYWASMGSSPTAGDGNIQRGLMDGPVRDNNPDTFDDLLTGLSNPRGISLDPVGGKIYWVEAYSGKVQRAGLNGSNPETLFDGLGNLSDIALDVDSGTMYWTDSGAIGVADGKVQRGNLDGTGVVQDVVTGLVLPRGLALDLEWGRIYWTDEHTGGVADGKIQRAWLDGSGVKDVVTGLFQPTGVALDLAAGKIYWTDPGANKIQRASLPAEACTS